MPFYLGNVGVAKPSGSDYRAALQHPNTAFQDAALRQAVPVKNKLGLPNLLSGNFAVVCHLRSQTDAWAVRCFVREIPDIHRRYREITTYLDRAKRAARCLVGFRYIDNEILVNGTREPVVVMDWVNNGTPLDKAVGEVVRQSASLQPLLDYWKAVDRELDELKIAHGDLQHGNVLVQSDRLRLVDYDGMFVPALNGEEASDLGHPNYQHPRRSKVEFNAEMDRFSSLVIYAALRALHHQPSLWAKYQMPDDALLFRQRDLADPDHSPLFADLARIDDPLLNQAVHHLRLSVKTGQMVPRLHELHRDANPKCWLPTGPNTTSPPTPSGPVHGWWKATEDAQAGTGGGSGAGTSNAGWWRDSQSVANQASGKPVQTPLAWPATAKSSGATAATPARSAVSQGSHPASSTTAAPAQAGAGTAVDYVVASQTSGKCHVTTCTYAQRIPRTKRMTFISYADAHRQGYDPCRICRPDLASQQATPVPSPNGAKRTPPAAPPPAASAPPSRPAPPPPPTVHQKWISQGTAPGVVRTPAQPVAPSPAGRAMPPPSATQRVAPPIAVVGCRVTIEFYDGGLFSFLLVAQSARQSRVDHVAADSSLGRAVIGTKVGSIIVYEELGMRQRAEVISIS